MSKTIKLTNINGGTPLTWTGNDNTHTFFGVAYGKYDVEVTEDGYETKTAQINVQESQSRYTYTLKAIPEENDVPTSQGEPENSTDDSEPSENSTLIATVEIPNANVNGSAVNVPYRDEYLNTKSIVDKNGRVYPVMTAYRSGSFAQIVTNREATALKSTGDPIKIKLYSTNPPQT